MAASSLFSGATLITGLALLLGLAPPMTPQPAPAEQPRSGPRHDAWKVIGPGGGGAQFLPTISPHDPNRVLVSCDMTGSYITHDGGETWRMFNLRGRARFFVFDPVEPDTIYAQSIGLWRSTDAGATWDLVYPRPEAVLGVEMPDDHASERIITPTGTAEAVLALAVDPANSQRLYAAFNTGRSIALRASENSGLTWAEVREFQGAVRAIYIDPSSPPEDRTLYVVLAGTVATREAGQWRTGPAPPGVESFADVSAGFPRDGGPLVVYAVAAASWSGETLSGGIFVSDDGGGSWRSAHDSLVAAMRHPAPAPRFPAIATSLHHASVAYVSAGNIRLGSDEVSLGVLKTEDAGRSWKFVWREAGVKSPHVDDGWISERLGPGWGSHPLDLGVSPRDPELCYGTDYGRTLKSSDGGQTWRAVYTVRAGERAYTSRGLDVTTAYGVHHDPFDARRIFISYTDIGLFRSEDGGASWTSSTLNGIPRIWLNTTYWVEFDPDVRGRMWAAMARNHDLPRPKMWRTLSPSAYQGGVARSDDGGQSWVTLTNGMPETAATHVLLDRRSPAHARVLYATGFGRGVYKSVDGGETWVQKNAGLPEKEPFAWRLAQDPEGILYLVVARRSENATVGTSGDGALYRSRDGAESWEKLPLPFGLNGPNGLTIDPRDPKRLYLSAWGRSTPRVASDGGIWLSSDGGGTWRVVHTVDQHVYDVTVDPENPDVLYACGFHSSVWRSTDRGETWSRIRGYNFKWGHRVVPDPVHPGMIYVTTFGGSVWHGPGAGDPDAVEDIVTPQLRHHR